MKIQKKIFFFGGGVRSGGCSGGGGGGSGWRGQGGCERRIEVFVKIQKKKIFFGRGGVGGGGGGSGWGGQGGCERRIEVFCENSKKKLGGGGGSGGSPGRDGNGFYHIWAWRPSWSCDPDAANKISFSLPKEAPHKIWL